MRRRAFLKTVALAGSSLAAAPARAARREGGASMKRLLLDSRVVEHASGVRLVPGKLKKHAGNPLFGEDKPWEPRFDNLYPNVMYDAEDKRFKCWYSPFIRDGMVAETPRENYDTVRYRVKDRMMGLCYAESDDGVTWRKPLMDVCLFDGQPSNIVAMGPHGTGVFKDLRDPDPARRYKMLYVDDVMTVAFSRDGIHWGDPIPCPEMGAVGDTHNNAFWCSERNCYVGITRLWKDGQRLVGRSESPDFLKWSKAECVLQGLERHLQTYAMPVFSYGGVYLGMPVVFNTETDRTHAELAWSPDTVTWRLIAPGTPFIGNGEEGACDWGCVYPAVAPVMTGGILIYYGGSNGLHTNWRDGFLCLATLGPDRFAGYEPEEAAAEGTITTTAMDVGSGVRVTADVAMGGAVEVTVLDPAGAEVAKSRPISETLTDGAVTWAKGGLPESGRKGMRLKFTLRKAMLYAFGFAEA